MKLQTKIMIMKHFKNKKKKIQNLDMSLYKSKANQYAEFCVQVWFCSLSQKYGKFT